MPDGMDNELKRATLRSDVNPQNIKYIPAVKIIARLDLEQNSSFLDGDYLMDINLNLWRYW